MASIAACNFCTRDWDAFLAGAPVAGVRTVAVGFHREYLDLPLEDRSAEQQRGRQVGAPAERALAPLPVLIADGRELVTE